MYHKYDIANRDETSSCGPTSFSMWDAQWRSDHNVGTWFGITENVNKFFNITNKFSVTVSANSELFAGHLIRIRFGCKRKCLMVKIKGPGKYPIGKHHYAFDSSNARPPVVGDRLVKPPVVTPDHNSQMWIKLGVIVAIVSIMVALCAIIFVAVHVCHLKSSCARMRTTSDTSSVSDPIPGTNIEIVAKPYKMFSNTEMQ